jgi:hypothetical protein
MGIDEIEARSSPPVPQQAGLNVVQFELFFQKGVIEQLDLAHREVVSSPPVGVQQCQFGAR